MVVKHAAGRDYPRSYAELRAWFDEDWKCLDYLDWLRWPEGFVCPHCASVVGWRLADSRWKCGGCDRRVSATAGTIFDKTRTPLTVWFATAWRMVGDKVGVSATQVQREMELGSYQTAWGMLHRYRSLMVRPGRDRLCGDVEVDESFLGGPEPGVPGRGALGKVLFAGAVELDESGFGRARLGVISNASAVSLAAFLDANVEPGSRVITDGWSAYPAATRDRYEHTGTSVAASGLAAHEVLLSEVPHARIELRAVSHGCAFLALRVGRGWGGKPISARITSRSWRSNCKAVMPCALHHARRRDMNSR